MEDIRRFLDIIIADANAKNVDGLTLGNAERLVEAIKTKIAHDAVFHGGKTEWARDWSPRLNMGYDVT